MLRSPDQLGWHAPASTTTPGIWLRPSRLPPLGRQRAWSTRAKSPGASCGRWRDRLRFANAERQPFEELLPVRVTPDRHPRGLDHRRADVTPALFGNPTAIVLLTRAMHPGAQPSVAHQLRPSVEPSDVADRRQQQHGIVHANAWQLHQEGGLLRPWLEAALADQLRFNLFDQGFETVQDVQIVAHAQLF